MYSYNKTKFVGLRVNEYEQGIITSYRKAEHLSTSAVVRMAIRELVRRRPPVPLDQAQQEEKEHEEQ